jgi:hypothetical protein
MQKPSWSSRVLALGGALLFSFIITCFILFLSQKSKMKGQDAG